MERARALIEARALRRRVESVDDRDTYVCRPHPPGEIDRALRGAQLVSAHRRGKTMWIETDAGPVLGLHLGMTGRVVVDGDAEGDPARGEDRDRGWDRFTICFSDGGTLVLRDRRRLSRVVLEPDIDRLGPDAGEVDRATFRARVGRGRAPVKARIMDQAVIAGVGNLLADEALWRAKLNPRRAAGSLSDPELDRLRRELRASIRTAIRQGGVHTGRVIPARRPGAACPRCGAEMRSARVAGRATWWCPAEQG